MSVSILAVCHQALSRATWTIVQQEEKQRKLPWYRFLSKCTTDQRDVREIKMLVDHHCLVCPHRIVLFPRVHYYKEHVSVEYRVSWCTNWACFKSNFSDLRQACKASYSSNYRHVFYHFKYFGFFSYLLKYNWPNPWLEDLPPAANGKK